jgi:cellulose synthase/poly-beta-1,6-N-acetylglucosamine synthase-like glycosyltransferase
VRGRHAPSAFSIILLLLPFIFGAGVAIEGYNVEASPILIIIAVGLTFTFFNNFFVVPLAVFHKIREGIEPSAPPYLVSIIVPAYNEEKVIARTIEALLEADYPRKEIIVVDDGSTDRTFEIASRYSKLGVKVCHKENGGKSSALNFGLRFARGEIIVTVDADSIVGRDALKEIVKSFRNKNVGAVCGNIKVLNTVNWLTRCQALEYVVSINLFRRAFDLFGAVTVVPGALGAFRRSMLEAGGLYDKDVVTEDFDVTIKTLKSGSIVQASSSAVAYTEAPQTLKDLYRQRIRWYRGNFQTIIKHKDAFTNPRYGYLQRLSFPFIIISMTFLPLAGMAVLASVVIAMINGKYMFVALLYLIFISLQTLISILAIEIDEEDLRLAAYAPFFVVGYKNLIDAFIIKAMLDVLLKRRVSWTRAERIGLMPAQTAKKA